MKIGLRLVAFSLVTVLLIPSFLTVFAEENLYGEGDTPTGCIYATNPADLFSVYNSTAKYILLDNDSEGFFVMANEVYGERAFDTASGTYIKFDTSRSTNIANYINGTQFLNDNFPADIINNMISRTWSIEAGTSGSICPVAYSATCKTALMSAAEYTEYYTKIGVDTGDTDWFLRTPHPAKDTSVVVVASKTSGTRTAGRLYDASASLMVRRAIRPVFYLKPLFFQTVHLDVNTMGDNIKNYITSNYTKDEMSQVYNDMELAIIGYEGIKIPMATNIVINGGTVTGTPVTVSYEYTHTAGVSEGATTVKWMMADTPVSSYTEVAGEKDNSYIIKPADAGKYLCAEITPADRQGNVGYATRSQSVGPLPQSLGPISGQTTKFSDQPEKTPKENVFQVSGSESEFILLDDTGSGASKYFVMTKQDYGMRYFDADNKQRFDPSNKNNIAYYLNNTFISSENTGKRLPAGIVSYIDKEHTWLTGAGHPNGNAPYDYITKAGIALISFEEWNKYHTKIGYDDGFTNVGWWLRSTRGLQIDDTNAVLSVRTNVSKDFQGCAFQYGAAADEMVRPVFYLGEDFFKNVKINTVTAGDNVKKSILKYNSLHDLKTGYAGYTDNELNDLGFRDAPVANDVTFNGNAAKGDLLVGSYSYHGVNAESGSKYIWLISNTENGTYEKITGKEDKSLVIIDEYVDKYIKFSVIPGDSKGIFGMSADSKQSVKIRGVQPVSVTSVSVKGTTSAELTSIENAAVINVSFAFMCNDTKNRDIVLAAALYDNNEKLLTVKTQQKSVGAGTQTLNLVINRTMPDNAARLRVFAIDQTDGLKPLFLREFK